MHIWQHLPARVLISRQCAGIPCADMFRYACACTLNAQNAEFAEYMHAALSICMRLKRGLGCWAWQELEEEISRARDQSVTVRMLEQQLHQQQQNFQQQLEAVVAKGEQMAQLKRVGTSGTSSSNMGAKSSSGVSSSSKNNSSGCSSCGCGDAAAVKLSASCDNRNSHLLKPLGQNRISKIALELAQRVLGICCGVWCSGGLTSSARKRGDGAAAADSAAANCTPGGKAAAAAAAVCCCETKKNSSS